MVKHVFRYITVVNSYYYLPLKFKKEKEKTAVGRRYKRNYLLMIVTRIVLPNTYTCAHVCLLSLYSHRFPYAKKY